MSADTLPVPAWPPSPHGDGRPGQCKAKAKSTGERCQRQAIAGGTVCTVHGGLAPSSKRAAARRLAEAEARATLAALVPDDVGPVVDVLGAIAQLCGELVTAREAAAGMVRRLDGLTNPHTGAAAPEVALWLALVDKSTKALEAAARLDLDARRAALTARTLEAVAAVWREMMRWAIDQMRAGATPAEIEAGWPAVWRQAIERTDPRSWPQ